MDVKFWKIDFSVLEIEIIDIQERKTRMNPVIQDQSQKHQYGSCLDGWMAIGTCVCRWVSIPAFINITWLSPLRVEREVQSTKGEWRSNNVPVVIRTTMPRLWFLNTSNKRNQSSLEKWLILGLYRENMKWKKGMSKAHRSQPKRTVMFLIKHGIDEFLKIFSFVFLWLLVMLVFFKKLNVGL